MLVMNLSTLIAAADPATFFAVLGGTVFGVVAIFLLWLVVMAFFIHLAAHVMGFPAGLGTAMRAVLWQILFIFLFGIAFGLASAVLPPVALVAPFLIQWLGAAFGIKQAYHIEFFRALIAAFLSGLIAWVAIVIIAIVAMILMGASLQQMRDKMEQEKAEKPTTSVEWNDAREISRAWQVAYYKPVRAGVGETTRSTPVHYLLRRA